MLWTRSLALTLSASPSNSLYAISDVISLESAAEVFWDDDGFYVVSFANTHDARATPCAEAVDIDPRTVGGGKTTYGAITVGCKHQAADAKAGRRDWRSARNPLRPFS